MCPNNCLLENHIAKHNKNVVYQKHFEEWGYCVQFVNILAEQTTYGRKMLP